jgi:hypothetical protein
MHPVIQKTFGGLSKEYYFRQFVFGLLFPTIVVFMTGQAKVATPIFSYVLFVVNSLLYPYSRFVYESVISFIVGKNVFYVNAVFMLVVKLITMTLCWAFAIFIAPVGLIYLYFANSK